MSEERLLSSLNESESVQESEKRHDARIEKIKKNSIELRNRFLIQKWQRLEKIFIE